MSEQIKIIKETQDSDGFLKLFTADVEHTLVDGRVMNYKRSKVEREAAVGIVIENVDTGKLIFVRQYRYAVGEKTNPMMLEIVAGRIEGNDPAEETAKREIEEEVGYKVSELTYLTDYFTSPGYSSEIIHLFHAKVKESDKTSEGGGLLSENEFLKIEEYSTEEALELLMNGEIKDGKSQLALTIFFFKLSQEINEQR